MRRVAYPFLTLSDAAVQAAPWSCSLNGDDWQVAGEFLADWDAESTTRFRRTLAIDPKVASSELGVVADHLALSIGLRVGTGPGRIPFVLRRECHRLSHGTWKQELEIELAGHQLSATIDLELYVILAAPPRQYAQLSPRQVANRLWSDTLRVRIEGEEPRFPIELADMRQLIGDTSAASAPWYLYWSPLDWNRDFHGAVRLYLNKDDSGLVSRVMESDEPTLQTVLADVMGQICERLLTESEAAGIIAEAEPGSIAAQASAWLGTAWPGKDIAFIRSLRDNRPGQFRSAFLVLAELGEV